VSENYSVNLRRIWQYFIRMKISYNWLKQYIDTELSPEEIGKILTETGLEVEGIERLESVKGGLEGVVVGEVVSCEKHPDADRLKVTTVTVGGEPLQIVCGAPNVAVGQKVAVATVGTTLYPSSGEAIKMKLSKIRGVESHGMLCAEDELGLGESHDGILVLNPALTIGTPVAQVFELEDDFQIEIGLTPNRADAMGHIGVARDLMAYINYHHDKSTSINWPDVSSFKVENNDKRITVSVADAALCPRYVGTVIDHVKIEPSPAWLQKRLRAVGLSPINNVVDVTNFVMRELGTPLHAFDLSALNGNVVVKTANAGDKFTTLDGIERTLGEEQLMITNGDDYLCIAGVFGGTTSGITEHTTSVFLESAYFNPVSVRKTARFHGLNTDASFRFERGVDPELTMYAMKRAALLIVEVAGGHIAMEPCDLHAETPKPASINFNFKRCNQLIGSDIPEEGVKQILSSLDIKVVSENGDDALLKVPAYRVDVQREADVIEEVLRIYGFNNVPLPEKLNTSIGASRKPDVNHYRFTLAEMLVGKGFFEVMNNSLTSSTYVATLGNEELRTENNVQMLNPLSQELDVMRQCMVFGILEGIRHNQNRQHPDWKCFEFGTTYHKYGDRYVESKRLVLAITGRKQAESWNSTTEMVNYFTMKGIVESILSRLGLKGFLNYSEWKNSVLEEGVELTLLKSKVGQIGWIGNSVKKHFGIKQEVFIADLDWDVLMDHVKNVKIRSNELPKTFATRRDFSLLLDKSVTFAEIERAAKACDRKILREVGLFDVYEGKNLDEGKKSYAVSFTFQDTENTLRDEAVDAVMEKIRKELESQLGAQLRS
jgi:phenylalanyl-tRNA synthetase beta chain